MGWRDRAACLGMDTDTFFPRHHRRNSTRAQAVCRSCPVVAECLRFILDAEWADGAGETRYGTFGGMTAFQRKQLHRRWTAAA